MQLQTVSFMQRFANISRLDGIAGMVQQQLTAVTENAQTLKDTVDSAITDLDVMSETVSRLSAVIGEANVTSGVLFGRCIEAYEFQGQPLPKASRCPSE